MEKEAWKQSGNPAWAALDWATDPGWSLTKDEAAHFMSLNPKAVIENAFAEGVVVGFEQRTIDGQRGNTDLEIRVFFRHKSAVKP